MLLPPEIQELRTLVTSLTQRVAERYAVSSADDDELAVATAAVLAVAHEATSKLLCERNGRITVNCLPTEILGKILRQMQLDAGKTQVLIAPTCASLVCRRWRAVALATPCLWSTLAHIKGQRVFPIPVFKSLLQRSEAMSVRLPDDLSAEHIAILSAEMHRISKLSIHARHCDDVPLSPLQRCAPQLQYFEVRGTSDYLPRKPTMAMFGGYAPMLRTLLTSAEFLGPSIDAPALEGVRTAHILATDGQHFVQSCTSIFNQLKHLTSLSVRVPRYDSTPLSQPIHHNLHSLRLEGIDDILALLPAFDHARIRSISIRLVRRSRTSPGPGPDLSTVLTPLRGPITHIGINCVGHQHKLYGIELSDSRGFVRTIDGIWETPLSSFLSHYAHLAWSIKSVTVAGSFDKLPALGVPLGQLELLSIGLHLSHPDPQPPPMLLRNECRTLPVLRMAAASRNALTLDAAELLSFVRDISMTDSDPVRISELRLEGITLKRGPDPSVYESSMRALSDLVDTIIFTDTPWTTLAIPIFSM